MYMAIMNKKTVPSFGYLLNDVTRHFRTEFDRRATRFELTRAQWRALKTVAHREGLSQADLAERMEMEPIPVGRVIDRLQQAGFVERRADPADRRRWCLYLTAKAHAVVDDMEEIAAGLRSVAVDGIPAADIDTCIAVLERMKNNLLALERSDEVKP